MSDVDGMTSWLSDNIGIIIGAIAIIIILGIILSGYVKAPPDIAFIISGLKKKPKVLIGRAGIKIPFLERKDALLLKQISIDIKTNGYVPTHDFIGVDIDAVAKVQIEAVDESMRERAMRNFLNMDESDIITALTDSLQGNLREIIGTVDLKDLNIDRKKFGDQIQEKAQIDMNALGVRIISCNIQRIDDENNLINALGMDNMAQIQKDASIAKANADRDVAIAQATAQREANEAEVEANKIIAERNTELEIRKAELKREQDTQKAIADAAYSIQEQEQRKTIEVATTNAEIAKQERETELKAKEANVREQQLNAEIRKTADADKYKKQQEAEARLIEQQREADAVKAMAEAELYKKQKEAEGIAAVGKAEAEAIEAKGIAEAEAMEKKALAYQKYNSAAVTQMIIEQLPSIAREVASPISAIDKVTIIDSGNGESGVGNVGGYVPAVLAKTFEAVKETTGFDLKEVMKAQTYDAKVNRNVNVDYEPDGVTVEGVVDKKPQATKKTRRRTVRNTKPVETTPSDADTTALAVTNETPDGVTE